MFKLKPFQSVFLWFFILGQNNYISIFYSKSRLLRILYWIFRGFYIFIMLISIVVAYHQFRSYTPDLRLHIIVFIVLIPNFIEIIDSWIYTSTLTAIVSEIHNSIDYLENNVNAKIDINQFICDFHKKIIFSSIWLLIDCVYKLCVSTPLYTIYSNIVLSFVATYKHFAILHAIFLIDLQSLILKSLSNKINPPCIDEEKECLVTSIPTTNTIQILHHIKVIYSSVWENAEKMNKRFGSCLLFMLIYFGIIIVQLVMVTFTYIYSYQDKLLIMRKLKLYSFQGIFKRILGMITYDKQ